MSSRQKYRKQTIGPAEKITARNSLVGLIVLADYVDPASNQRTLVFERPSKSITIEAAKPIARKKRSVNGADDSPSKSLAFPGESAPSA